MREASHFKSFPRHCTLFLADAGAVIYIHWLVDDGEAASSAFSEGEWDLFCACVLFYYPLFMTASAFHSLAHNFVRPTSLRELWYARMPVVSRFLQVVSHAKSTFTALMQLR
jgi:hypothetical protein